MKRVLYGPPFGKGEIPHLPTHQAGSLPFQRQPRQAPLPERAPTPSSREDRLSEGYAVPSRVTRVEERIRRSRFITYLAPAATRDEAADFLATVKQKYPDATHHCWAFVAGPPGTTSQVGMSDDGEPHGTAGRPMLNALLHGDLGDVVAVVVRYYGGVKLGTGGLARAYTSGVVAALGAAESRIKVELGRWHVGVAYDLVQAVEKAVGEQAWSIAAREFGEAVTLVIEAPRHEEDRVRETLADATSGRASVREEGV